MKEESDTGTNHFVLVGLYMHAVGEFLALPEDRLSEAVVEVIPSRLGVGVYRAAFPPAIAGAAKAARASGRG